MPDNQQNFTDFEPFEIVTEADETDGAFVQVEYMVHPDPASSDTESDLSHSRWAVDLTDEHVHPKFEESFEVLAGDWKVAFAGDEYFLSTGNEISIPMGVPHRHWNPSDQPTQIRLEARPAQQFGAVLETAYTLAQAGKADESGLPNILQLAVTLDAYPDHFYPTDLPIWVQKGLFRILAPLGRLVGYKARYSREEIDDIR